MWYRCFVPFVSAKSGAQGIRRRTRSERPWIPACAGMSGSGLWSNRPEYALIQRFRESDQLKMIP